jgi:hypothetical protein
MVLCRLNKYRLRSTRGDCSFVARGTEYDVPLNPDQQLPSATPPNHGSELCAAFHRVPLDTSSQNRLYKASRKR